MAHIRVAIGVDGCKGGWVFVRLENGAFRSAEFCSQFAAGVDASSDAAVIAVDMPIGYPPLPALERAADGLARNMVTPLTSSVFPTPHPDALRAPDWETAHEISQERTGRGLSRMSYALAPKILEVEAVAVDDERVYEVHPEVSFRELAGHPLASKKQWNGQAERRKLLQVAGIVIPDNLGCAGVVGTDDILDAAVAAWSANRIVKGIAASLPNPPELDPNGRGTAIWY